MISPRNVLLLALLLFSTFLFAKEITPPTPNPPGPGLPIDALSGLLGLTALVYGVFKNINNPKI